MNEIIPIRFTGLVLDKLDDANPGVSSMKLLSLRHVSWLLPDEVVEVLVRSIM